MLSPQSRRIDCQEIPSVNEKKNDFPQSNFALEINLTLNKRNYLP